MKKKREVFKIRFGINPNSSGHGFFMGLMLLLPILFINIIFLSFNSKIRKLLKEIKLEEKKLSKFSKLLLFFIWIIPWFYTIIFMEAFTDPFSFRSIIPIYYRIIISVMIILPLYLLIKKSIDNKKLYYITTKTFKYSIIISTVIVVIINLFYIGNIFSGNVIFMFHELFYFINILFVYPLILNLSISIYTVNNYKFPIEAVVGIFFIGCLITLFPFIPFPCKGYNPVGLFYPFWIYLFPLFITIKSLIDLNKRSEDTKN